LKRVLFVSYYFPPIGGIGTERPLAFARLLPEFGWEPVVLTPSESTIRVLSAGKGMEIPEGLQVRRTPNPDIVFKLKKLGGYDLAKNVEEELFGGLIRDAEQRGARMRLVRFFKNWSSFPDRTIDWYPFLVREGMRLLRTGRFDAIYTISPPYTAAVAGAHLSRRTGVPWVCDMADLWTHCFNYMRTGPAVKVDEWLERRTLKQAGRIIVLAERAQEVFDSPSDRVSDRVVIVPHGYDDRSFASVEAVSQDALTLVYAGQISYPFQDPGPVLDALALLRERGEDLSRFRFVYFGQSHDVVRRLAAQAGVSELVEVMAQIPYEEAMARQKGAGALLYIQWEPAGEIGTYSKFAQYIGARRPILALAPTPGAVDSVIGVTGAGRVARGTDDVAAIISDWLAEYRRDGRLGYGVDESTARSFSYSGRAKVIARVLDEAATGRSKREGS
jgi:Glycosyl transferase 4-like domain